MLDQNTDRMWYVIGAVIVGAVLIFLMNNTFPGLFGTIGTTFEEKVDAVAQEEIFQTTPSLETDGVMPKPTKGDDLLKNQSFKPGAVYASSTSPVYGDTVDSTLMYRTELFRIPAGTYELAGTYTGSVSTVTLNTYVQIYTRDTTRPSGYAAVKQYNWKDAKSRMVIEKDTVIRVLVSPNAVPNSAGDPANIHDVTKVDYLSDIELTLKVVE